MELKQVLEAILFVAEDPVPAHELAQVTESAVDEVEALLAEMAADSAGGIVVREAGGGWRMFSNPEARPYLERFAASPAATRLSRAALETLAVVAYRQPVSRPQVSEIRGVDSERSMATLERLGLVEDLGVGPGAGSPIMYGTTGLFLEQLGINALADLPPLADHVPPPEIVEALEAPFRPGNIEGVS